ncbi:MAG TPA: MarR family transcriptional regulator [Microlunatus sp.]|nr:MarR family transcriptional regulator [Microlunatus sp.]
MARPRRSTAKPRSAPPVEEAPVEEAPVEEAPVEEAPVEDSSPDAAAPPDASEEWEVGERRREFVESFGVIREMAGSPRMEGRVLGYLMTSTKPYVSSAELAGALKASAGSISITTRHLIESGFVTRHAVPGDRSHYFKVDDDIWGSFLAGERRYLDRQRAMFVDLLADLPPGLDGPRRRLRNARNYMEWLASYHRKMLADWKAYNESHSETDPEEDR